MSTITGYVVTMVKELDGLVETKEFVTYEEVVAETCSYISSQAAVHSPRKSSVGIETMVTYWDVKIAEVGSYLRTRFIENYYTTWNKTVTIKVNLYPTNLEREKTVANRITIKALMSSPLPPPPIVEIEAEEEPNEKFLEACEKEEERYERFLARHRE